MKSGDLGQPLLRNSRKLPKLPDVTRHLRPKVNASNRRHLIAVYNTQEPRCMDFKCGRQFPYVVEPNIDRSTLDAAHVGAVQPGTICSTLKRLRFIVRLLSY